jgi:hypothetical protein
MCLVVQEEILPVWTSRLPKVKAAPFSETSGVACQLTLRHIREDLIDIGIRAELFLRGERQFICVL